jgi:hypothetical protein
MQKEIQTDRQTVPYGRMKKEYKGNNVASHLLPYSHAKNLMRQYGF